jgi:pimeloyl-ACP methyl ester carboxylesterase
MPGGGIQGMRILAGVLAVVVALVAGLAAFDYFVPYTSARIAVELEQRRSGLRERQATIPGFDIAYLDGGQGEPLLLIHGLGAEKNNFTRVARFLTPHYRVLVPDLPGFGASSKPADASYSIDDDVERLRAFAQGLGVKRAHLGGSSMGGWIATAWAARYPEEVASLWLLAPAGTAAAGDSELARHYRETGEILLMAKTPGEHARLRGFVMSRPPFLPYSFRRILAEQAAADYPLHSRIFAALAREKPLESWVRRVDAPALIVWGTEDRALNPKGGDALRALMPNGRVVLMPGIGHLPMIEAVRESAEEYLTFRRTLAGT